MSLTVTAEISTKDRYATTLPLALMSVASQTYPIKRLFLFDDGECKDLRKIEPYEHIFSLLSRKGIEWQVVFGQKRGQVHNHQSALLAADTDLIWRLDDDDFTDSTALERLVARMADDVGAVTGVVWDSGMPISAAACSPRIEDLRVAGNIQWSDISDLTEVDHMYNTFLFRRKAAQHGYNLGLSPVGHGEESLFTYGIKRNGYRLLVDPAVKIWHLKQPTGGIRSYSDGSMWEGDEKKVNNILYAMGVRLRGVHDQSDEKLIYLNNGIGDHIMFRMILPEVLKKHGKVVIACCYPEVFADDLGSSVRLISIADAKAIYQNIDETSVYKWAWDNNWQGSFVEAFRRIYL
jgi:hypothetical protein